jgi:hypothetical protein
MANLNEARLDGADLSGVSLRRTSFIYNERYARLAAGISDKDPIIEKPDAGKRARPLLKPSGADDPVA